MNAYSLMMKDWQKKTLFTVLVLLETVLLGLFAETESDIPSILYVLAGFGIALMPFITASPQRFGTTPPRVPVSLVASMLLAVLFVSYVPSIFEENPVDHTRSDVIPVIMTMARRFAEGEPVYSIMTEFWGGTWPIYMPAMWLPYVAGTLGDFDPRWISVGFLIVAACSALRPWKRVASTDIMLMAALPVCAMLALLTSADQRLIIYSQESVVAAWYVLLGLAILYRNPYLIGAAVALATFSRYSFAFWFAAYMLYLVLTRQFRFILRISATGFVVTLLLLVPTGAIEHLRFFLGLDDIYLNAIRPNNEWKMQGTVYRGLGLARFWKYANLKDLYTIFFIVNILVPLATFAIMWRKYRAETRPLMILASLKLAFVCFYNLLIIPVPTLFYTSNILSFVLLYAWLEPPGRAKNPVV